MMVSQRELHEAQTALFIARVRNLQAAHSLAHQALTNWGHWSADKRGMYPTLKPPSLWSQFKQSEADDYGEEIQAAMSVVKQEAKAEALEIPPYNELQALEIDARLHGYGGPSVEYRMAVRAAYVTREIPEDQFPKFCGCGEDAFCERLGEVLKFVGRFL